MTCSGWLAFVALALFGPNALAQRCVQDDLNQPVCVNQAQRLVVLAPHLTELVGFVGGLRYVVAVDEASNFPVEVNALPKIGHSWMLGAESILARKPDLVLAWQSGISREVLVQLRESGVPVFVSEPETIEQIASTMRRLSILLGTADATRPKMNQWLESFEAVRVRYAKKSRVPVFYQVWGQPLMTLGGKHVVSEILALCGGQNVFSDFTRLALQVGVEGVLKRNPALMLTSGSQEDSQRFVNQWSRWPQLDAVRHGRVKTIPQDILVRNGPRLLEAVKWVCTYIEQARR